MEKIHRKTIGAILIVGLGALFGYLFVVFRLGPTMLKYTFLEVALLFCFTTPALYAASRYSGFRGLMAGVIVLTLAHSILFKYTDKKMHFQLFLFYLVSGLTVWLYQAHIVRVLYKLRIGKFIIFAGLFVFAHFLVLSLGFGVFGELPVLRQYMVTWSIGTFLAFGVGLGIELAELIIRITVEPFSDEGIVDDRA